MRARAVDLDGKMQRATTPNHCSTIAEVTFGDKPCAQPGPNHRLRE
jgi:hypothetical protein